MIHAPTPWRIPFSVSLHHLQPLPHYKPGFTPSPHDPSARPSTPRTPRQPFAPQPNTSNPSSPGPSSSGTRAIGTLPSTPQGQKSNFNSSRSKGSPIIGGGGGSSNSGTPDKQHILSSLTKSLYPSGTSHFTSSPFNPHTNANSKSASTPSKPGSTYTPGSNRAGWGKDKSRKVMDMGAPVFVKAGTLFVDDAHQPDMVVGE